MLGAQSSVSTVGGPSVPDHGISSSLIRGVLLEVLMFESCIFGNGSVRPYGKPTIPPFCSEVEFGGAVCIRIIEISTSATTSKTYINSRGLTDPSKSHRAYFFFPFFFPCSTSATAASSSSSGFRQTLGRSTTTALPFLPALLIRRPLALLQPSFRVWGRRNTRCNALRHT